MKKLGTFFVASLILMSGCESYNQMHGVFMGGTLGSIFGSSIGGLMDGPRGSDAGTAVGMIIGGVVGAAATAPKASRHNDSNSMSATDTYGGISYENESLPVAFQNLEIENLRFVDENNNRSLDSKERAKLIFEIHNTGSTTVYDVAPVVNVSDTKYIMISPTAIIASIPSGKTVKYTAELYGKPKLRSGYADFSIGFAYGKKIYTVRTFQLETAANRT